MLVDTCDRVSSDSELVLTMSVTMNGRPDKSPQGPFTAFVDHNFAPTLISSPATSRKHKHSSHEGSTAAELDEIVRVGDSKRLKAFLRNNNWAADDPIRHTLWFKVCCMVHKDVARGISIYQDMVTKVFGEGEQ